MYLLPLSSALRHAALANGAYSDGHLAQWFDDFGPALDVVNELGFKLELPDISPRGCTLVPGDKFLTLVMETRDDDPGR